MLASIYDTIISKSYSFNGDLVVLGLAEDEMAGDLQEIIKSTICKGIGYNQWSANWFIIFIFLVVWKKVYNENR